MCIQHEIYEKVTSYHFSWDFLIIDFLRFCKAIYVTIEPIHRHGELLEILHDRFGPKQSEEVDARYKTCTYDADCGSHESVGCISGTILENGRPQSKYSRLSI